MRGILRLGKSFRLYCFNVFINKIPFTTLRLIFVRLYLTLGKNSNVCQNVKILNRDIKKDQIVIGKNSVVNPDCLLDGRFGRIVIGDNVDIARGTWIFTLEHDPHSDNHEIRHADVIIEQYVWICARCLILPGVKIGYGSVIAANSTVTRDIPPMSMAAGSPAKVIGTRKSGLKYSLNFLPNFYV